MRRSVVTIVGDMDGSDFLPNDLRECQRLLLAAFQQATQLERRVAESERQAAELNRVLSGDLKQELYITIIYAVIDTSIHYWKEQIVRLAVSLPLLLLTDSL